MINQDAPRLAAQQKPPTGRLPLGNSRKELGIFALLVVLCMFTGIRNHNFFGVDNMQDLARLVGIYGIFSIGAGIVIITGGIDLSVGSVFALEGVLAAMMLQDHHWFPPLAVALCLALTVGLGLFHGLLITRVPLQPFIVTLCGLMFYRGIARFISGDNSEGFGDGTGFHGLMSLATGNFSFIHRLGHVPFFHFHHWHPAVIALHFHYWQPAVVKSSISGLPMPFLAMIIIAVVMWVVLHRSIYGRYLYAVGRNEEAARYSGINSRRIITSVYVVAGALTGIAGLLLAFYTNSISPSSHGNSYELYGIAAAVLGGCSLRGGEGSIIGILIGTALLQVLQNLVNLLGIPSSLNLAVVGAVILIGVITDEVIKRRSLQKARA